MMIKKHGDGGTVILIVENVLIEEMNLIINAIIA